MSKTEMKDMPISITERKKAEELIKAKFRTLEKSLDDEVLSKRDELNELWSKKIGLDKLRAKRTELQEQLDVLDEQLGKVTDGYSNYAHAVPKPTGQLRVALDRLEAAQREARNKLDEKKNETLEQLWFGLLSADALELLAKIPTMTQLKSNGMSLLQLPAAKMLGVGK